MDINKLDSHIYKPYEEELTQFRARFMQMGGLVEQQLLEATRAIDEVDSGIAEKVLEKESLIDEMEMELDEACTQIIARRQPVASDLRAVLATNRCVNDLERIGDEAQKIAKMAVSLSEGSSTRGYKEVRHISSAVSKMLNEALDAFARLDVDAALRVMDLDKSIDEDYQSAIRELITFMMEDPRSISRTINILWVLRSLERIGDHAKNICEAIVYIVKAKDIRHGNRDLLAKK